MVSASPQAGGGGNVEGVVRNAASWVVLLLLVTLSAACVPASSAALDEVPNGDWSYAAIDSLMQRGLVQGYKAAPYSGPTPLTRAEMAGLVARAVRGVGAAMRARGEQLQMLAQAPAAPESQAAPEATPESQPAPAVTQEDLARIEKLLAEFRNELVTMGANVDKIAKQLADLQKSVADTRKQVDKMAQEAARHKISGYAQLRYTIDGSATPASQFAVRRAKIGLSGPLGKITSYKVEFDAPTQSSSTQSTVILNQAYAAIDLRKATLFVGQFYVPFGWEEFTPAKELEAPEEALLVKRLFANQKYDRGVRVDAPLGSNWVGRFAVFNGTGYRRGDTNDRKDVALRVSHVGKSLEYGVSGYFGKDTVLATSTTPRADANRNLFGAYVFGSRGKGVLKGEMVVGKAAASDAIAAGAKDVLGWTALAGYVPSWKDELAVRFNQFDPDRDSSHNVTNWTSLIWLHWLEQSVRLRLAGDFVRPDAGGSYNVFTTELQIMY
jgi:hypothetical protein